MKDKGHERIFPELRCWGGKYGKEATKIFSEFMYGLGFPRDNSKTHHSFRSTVLDFCKHNASRLGIDLLAAYQFVGHATQLELRGIAGSMAEQHYTTPYTVKEIYENVVLKLDFGMDFSVLKRSKFSGNE